MNLKVVVSVVFFKNIKRVFYLMIKLICIFKKILIELNQGPKLSFYVRKHIYLTTSVYKIDAKN